MEEDTTLDGSPVETPTSTPPQQTDTTDWKGRYNAASSELGRVKKELEQYKAKYATALTDLEAYRADTTNAADSLQKALEEKERALAEKEGRLQAVERREKLGATIMTDFPELLPLHLKKLVDVGNREGEEMTAYLRDLAETVGAISTQQKQQQQQGTTPPPPRHNGTTPKLTEAELYAKMMRLDPRTQEYRDLKVMLDEARKNPT